MHSSSTYPVQLKAPHRQSGPSQACAQATSQTGFPPQLTMRTHRAVLLLPPSHGRQEHTLAAHLKSAGTDTWLHTRHLAMLYIQKLPACLLACVPCPRPPTHHCPRWRRRAAGQPKRLCCCVPGCRCTCMSRGTGHALTRGRQMQKHLQTCGRGPCHVWSWGAHELLQCSRGAAAAAAAAARHEGCARGCGDTQGAGREGAVTRLASFRRGGMVSAVQRELWRSRGDRGGQLRDGAVVRHGLRLWAEG